MRKILLFQLVAFASAFTLFALACATNGTFKPPIICPDGTISLTGTCPVASPPPSVPPTTIASPPPSTLVPPSPSPSPGPGPSPSPSPSAEPPYPATQRSGLANDGTEDGKSIFGGDVLTSISTACGGCTAGSGVSDWQAFLKAVRAALVAKGFTTSYDWTHGDVDASTCPRDDKGQPILTDPSCKPFDSELSIWKGCRIESFQLVQSARKVRTPPGAFTSWAYIAPGQCVSLCPLHLPVPKGYLVLLELKPGGQQVGGTPYVKDDGLPLPPPGWTGSCRGPHRCDIGPDKDFANGLECARTLCGDHLDYDIAGDADLNWPFPSDRSRPPGADNYGAKFTMRSATSTATLVATCPVSGLTAQIGLP